MISHEQDYIEFIKRNGVGDRDRVASSPDSYRSYLNSVSKLIGEDITPALLNNHASVAEISKKLDGKRAPKTVRNYCSAMRCYVDMVRELGLKS